MVDEFAELEQFLTTEARGLGVQSEELDDVTEELARRHPVVEGWFLRQVADTRLQGAGIQLHFLSGYPCLAAGRPAQTDKYFQRCCLTCSVRTKETEQRLLGDVEV